MANQFDVIIIGSGAGGGTLACHLAPSGKRILLLERGDWLKREPENWITEEVFVNNRYVSPDIWRDKNGKPFQPGVHYFVGGATKMYGAALYRLRKEDFGERATPGRHLAGLAHQLRRAGAVLHQSRADVPRTRRPRRRSDRAALSAHRTRIRPCRTSRGSPSWPTIWRGPATSRFIRRAASCWTNRGWRSAAAFAASIATASRAWSTPRATPKCWACGRRSSIRT